MRRIKEINLGEDVKVLGKILEIKMLPYKSGKGFVCNLGVTDGESTLKCVYFLNKNDRNFKEKFDYMSSLKLHDVLILEGRVSLLEDYNFLNIKRDGISTTLPTEQLTIRKIEKLDDETTKRKELSDVKRVEFQTFSNYSTLNSLIQIEKLVEMTDRFNYPSVVVTDRGTAHSFPVLEGELSKYSGLKGIYGCEFKTTEENSSPIINGESTNTSFELNEYVFFDIETSGLYPLLNEIIEIGAVKVKGNEIIDTFNVLIKPQKPISSKISNLTNISNELLNDKGVSESEGISSFLNFVSGNEVFVGHNVSFDYSFLNFRMKKHSIVNKISNSLIVDTLLISEMLSNDLNKKRIKSHRLNNLLKRYGYEIENHHRATDDSISTYKLFNFLMDGVKDSKGKIKFHGIKDYNINNLKELNEVNSKKLRNRFEDSILVYAKNQKGLKSLYELVSLNNTIYNETRVLPLNEILKRRENLIIISNGFLSDLTTELLNGEISIKKWEKYDYIGLHSIYQSYHLLDVEEEDVKFVTNKILDISKKMNKKCIVLGDVHYLNKKEEKYFKIVQNELKRNNINRNIHRNFKNNAYFKTVDELHREFYFVEEELRKEIISINPLQLSNEFDWVEIVPKDLYVPTIEGSDNKIKENVNNRLISIFGSLDKVPTKVKERVDYELSKIIGKFGVIYYVMHLVINQCLEEGHNVESRGSVGSSYVAYLMNITDINPLDVHYYCSSCKFFEFVDGEYESGFDLDVKECKCGGELIGDGQKMPFEMFVGYDGTKTPDIDINLSGKLYQSKAHDQVREIFGEENVYRAGTISTYSNDSSKYATWQYLKSKGSKEIIPFEELYSSESVFFTKDDKGKIKKVPKVYPKMNEIVIDELVVSGKKGNKIKSIVRTTVKLKTTDLIEYSNYINGLKLTTGQHSGGLMIIPQDHQVEDFFPVSYPSERKKENSNLISHMAYKPYEDTLLKLDLLGHDNPTKFYHLQNETTVKLDEIPMSDLEVIKMFRDGKTEGISEFNTQIGTEATIELQPTKFSHLVRISGLTHGTGVFEGNARELIKEGSSIEEVIACREDMLEYLSQKIPNEKAFNIMEKVRKGRGVSEEEEKMMLEEGIPQWYIDSMKKIQYLFPKAHATSYVISAYKLMWWKRYYPLEFTKVLMDLELSNTKNNFHALIDGEKFLDYFNDIQERVKDGKLKPKERDSLAMFKLINYFIGIGYKVHKVDLNNSHENQFTYHEDGLLMPLKVIPNLNERVIKKILELRKEKEVTINDLDKLTKSEDLIKSIKKYT